MACTPSMLTSGSVGKGENSRTWLSLSAVTTWYLKMKAAPRSNAGSCFLLTVEYCTVSAMKSVAQMCSSAVSLKEIFVTFDDEFFVLQKEF